MKRSSDIHASGLVSLKRGRKSSAKQQASEPTNSQPIKRHPHRSGIKNKSATKANSVELPQIACSPRLHPVGSRPPALFSCSQSVFWAPRWHDAISIGNLVTTLSSAGIARTLVMHPASRKYKPGTMRRWIEDNKGVETLGTVVVGIRPPGKVGVLLPGYLDEGFDRSCAVVDGQETVPHHLLLLGSLIFLLIKGCLYKEYFNGVWDGLLPA